MCGAVSHSTPGSPASPRAQPLEPIDNGVMITRETSSRPTEQVCRAVGFQGNQATAMDIVRKARRLGKSNPSRAPNVTHMSLPYPRLPRHISCCRGAPSTFSQYDNALVSHLRQLVLTHCHSALLLSTTMKFASSLLGPNTTAPPAFLRHLSGLTDERLKRSGFPAQIFRAITTNARSAASPSAATVARLTSWRSSSPASRPQYGCSP